MDSLDVNSVTAFNDKCLLVCLILGIAHLEATALTNANKADWEKLNFLKKTPKPGANNAKIQTGGRFLQSRITDLIRESGKSYKDDYGVEHVAPNVLNREGPYSIKDIQHLLFANRITINVISARFGNGLAYWSEHRKSHRHIW